MSLQTGTELARTKSPVIDPRTLKIIAYELEGPLLDQNPSFLRIEDVRELGEIGMIIDSSDEFVGLDDVIKLKEVVDLNFSLLGLTVFDEKKHKLGKIDDYTVEMGSFVIQQLNVKRPILKSLGDTELLVHRSQIVEITDTSVIVKSGKVNAEPIKSAVRTYVNPFRSSTGPQPETVKIDRN
jgi:sporulation protein YlmC with PRC-barrel domain